MTDLPQKLQRFLDAFAMLETRSERIQFLIDVSDRFREVSPDVAERPFPRNHLAPHCESEAYVWVLERSDGSVALEFAVENPQGISARALAVVLRESLSGESASQVARVPADLASTLFGRELSMGKSMGLTGMIAMVKREAARLAAKV